MSIRRTIPKFNWQSEDLQICFSVGWNCDELPVLRLLITRRRSTVREDCDPDHVLSTAGRPQMTNSMERVAGLAVAHRAGNAFTFGDGIDTVNSGQCHSLHSAAGPVNLQLFDFSQVTQTKVDAHVI